MVRPQELIDVVLLTLQRSDALPDSTNYVGYEPDIQSESIKLPLVEVSPITQSELSDMNSDFVGFQTDSDGREIGRIYESLYTLDLRVAVWTAQGSRYTPRELGNTIRDELYKHATAGPNQPLLDEEGSPVDEVWRFVVEDGTHTDDLGTSPILRRWQQTISVSASEQYVTEEEAPTEDINLSTTQP